MARKKKKPAKKPAPLTPALRAVRSAIERATGANMRANRVSERAAGRVKGFERIPEVMPKDDPRHPEHLTVCVYIGAAAKGDLPVDVIKWGAATVKYAISQKAALHIKPALIAGKSVTYASNVTGGMITLFAVLESGRAVDDVRRAALLTSKASGVLN